MVHNHCWLSVANSMGVYVIFIFRFRWSAVWAHANARTAQCVRDASVWFGETVKGVIFDFELCQKCFIRAIPQCMFHRKYYVYWNGWVRLTGDQNVERGVVSEVSAFTRMTCTTTRIRIKARTQSTFTNEIDTNKHVHAHTVNGKDKNKSKWSVFESKIKLQNQINCLIKFAPKKNLPINLYVNFRGLHARI